MAEAVELSVRTPGVDCGILMTPVSPGLFRVAEAAWFVEEFDYGDLVELRAVSDGKHEFVRVVEVCQLARSTWVVSKDIVDSVELAEFFTEIEAIGGFWENAMGGAVLVAVPVADHFDLLTRFERVCHGAGTAELAVHPVDHPSRTRRTSEAVLRIE